MDRGIKKIDEALIEIFYQINLDLLNEGKFTNAFKFLKNEIARDIDTAKSSKETSIEDIDEIKCLQDLTIEKIREIKSKNLIESNSHEPKYFNNQREYCYDESGDTMHSLAYF